MPNGTPEPPQNPENGRSHFFLRGSLFVAVCFFVISDVALYSAYKALSSRVQAQDHRIERLQKMVTDMIKANQNAAKVQKIETQVSNIETQVNDLSTTLQEEADNPPKRKRKRR